MLRLAAAQTAVAMERSGASPDSELGAWDEASLDELRHGLESADPGDPAPGRSATGQDSTEHTAFADARREPQRPREDSGRGKSRPLAALLAILLGGLGVHRFYLGDIAWGAGYLLFCWSGIPVDPGVVRGARLPGDE